MQCSLCTASASSLNQRPHSQRQPCPPAIPRPVFDELCSQGYHVVGNHSANKRCKWFREALIGNGGCYKARFYGIQSHRCVQCTPVLLFCNHACKFCWRIIPESKLQFEDMPSNSFKWDSPEKVAEGILREQERIASGYKGNPKTSIKKFNEAMTPLHVAISLTGEPTMYPYLGELIRIFHQKGLTTFLVTNGTNPTALSRLSPLPTQLYISMVAPNKENYLKTCVPVSASLWQNYLSSLKLMGQKRIQKGTRTVLRMTLVRSLNYCCVEDYASQIKLAKPMFVEVKSYMHVGKGREKRGLSLSDMLSIEEIRDFANKLSAKTGYFYTDEHAPSRVVLLCRDKHAQANRLLPLSQRT